MKKYLSYRMHDCSEWVFDLTRYLVSNDILAFKLDRVKTNKSRILFIDTSAAQYLEKRKQLFPCGLLGS